MDITEQLRSHPDTVTISINGTQRPWLLGRRALRLAKEKGFDVDAMLAGLESAGTGEAVELVAQLLWVGLLPFEPDLVLDDLADGLSLADLNRLQDTLVGGLNINAGETNGTVGKGRRVKRP